MASSLTIDNAWSSVSLEERLDLISRANAEGVVAAFGFLLLVGSIAYGFDKILLLGLAFFGMPFVMQIYASYCWRKHKPELILKYLAARTVARRYGYMYRIPDLDVLLIFRGKVQEIYEDSVDELQAIKEDASDLDLYSQKKPSTVKEAWICLLRGCVIILVEDFGGAKMDFIMPFDANTTVEKLEEDQGDIPEGAMILTGDGLSRGRKLGVFSKYSAAMYVFEKQTLGIIDEHQTRMKALQNIQAQQM